MMKRQVVLLTILALFVVSLLTTSAGAIGGSFSFNSFDGHIEVKGTGSWLVDISITGTGLTAVCVNNGGNAAPGQNGNISVDINVPVQLYYNENTGKSETGNFKIYFSDYVSGTEAGCPNDQWWVDSFVGTLKTKLTLYDLTTNPPAVADLYGAICNYSELSSSVSCKIYQNPKW